MSAPPVIVIGAGLAGLACAWHLQRRGLSVRVVEAAAEVGGVLRTDRVDGFLLDRGFQVLQTAYPEARAVLDFRALRLHSFMSGAATRWEGRFRAIYDPLRHPSLAWKTLRSGLFTPSDAWRLAMLRKSVCGDSLDALLSRPAGSTLDEIESLGFSKKFATAFLSPFYRGVLLEAALASSSRIFEFTFRMFASMPTALPENGIAALPEQLAERLAPGSLSLSTRVDSIDEGHVTLSDGADLEASAIVVATDAAAARRWIPQLPEPSWNAVNCVYFSAPRAPLADPLLILDGDGQGPANHVCFPSEVCPSYAPAGRTLVSATVLGNRLEDDNSLTSAVKEQFRDWWGSEVDDWRPLRIDRIPQATPLQSPTWLEPATRSVRVGPRLFVCGGHRETSSIGGALRSGRRAAAALLEDPENLL